MVFAFAFAEWGLFFKQSFEIFLQLKTSENKLSDVLVRNHESASWKEEVFSKKGAFTDFSGSIKMDISSAVAFFFWKTDDYL